MKYSKLQINQECMYASSLCNKQQFLIFFIAKKINSKPYMIIYGLFKFSKISILILVRNWA